MSVYLFHDLALLATICCAIAVACRCPIDVHFRDATDEEKEKWK